MHVSMSNRLPRRVTAIHSDVEAFYRSILLGYVGSNCVDQLIDGTPFRLEQVKEGDSMPLRHHYPDGSAHGSPRAAFVAEGFEF